MEMRAARVDVSWQIKSNAKPCLRFVRSKSNHPQPLLIKEGSWNPPPYQGGSL